MGCFSARWIIAFKESMSISKAALYAEPFAHVAKHVKPARQRNRVTKIRVVTPAITSRNVACTCKSVALHRDSRDSPAQSVCPDHPLIVRARDDDTMFGILHSRFPELWSLRLGTWIGKGNDPRYTTTTFQTVPLPQGLEPNVPAIDYAANPRAIAVADAASKLVELRDRWLNPPEWVEWVGEPVSGFPARPVPRNSEVAQAVQDRTLTKPCNARPQWLADAHAALDASVATAYG